MVGDRRLPLDLAQHRDHRDRLSSEPALIHTAVEELLRAYAPVTMALLVAKDFDFHGHQMKEATGCCSPSLPPTGTQAPSKTLISCCLTRLTTVTPPSGWEYIAASALTLPGWNCGWPTRYPDYELSDPQAVTWSSGQIRGPRSLPVTILS